MCRYTSRGSTSVKAQIGSTDVEEEGERKASPSSSRLAHFRRLSQLSLGVLADLIAVSFGDVADAELILLVLE